MIDFEALSKESHATAVEKGWYEIKDEKIVQRNVSEVCALFHSEVSEAVEELRSPNCSEIRGIYFKDPKDGATIVDDPTAFPSGPPTLLDGHMFKPEGVAVELADLLIRMADSAQAWDVADLTVRPAELAERSTPFHAYPEDTRVGDLAELHKMVSNLYTRVSFRAHTGGALRDIMVATDMDALLTWVVRFCLTYNLALERAIMLKMAYNKTRGWRHGNKKA